MIGNVHKVLVVAFAVVVLSLVGASTALADPLYPDIATTEVNQSVTVDVLANDPFPDISQIFNVGGNCFTFDMRNVTYTPTTDFVGQESCGFLVMSPMGIYDSVLTVTVNPPAPVNSPPNALFNAAVTPGVLQVGFDASASTDPDVGDSIVSYAWDFGDGGTDSGVTTSHTYATAGTYTVTLTATDSHGATNVYQSPVTVTAPQVVDQKPVEVVVQNAVVKTGTADVQVTFPVKLSRPSVVPIVLNYSTRNGTADVTGNTSGSITILAGVTKSEISFTVTSNSTKKGAQTFFLADLSTTTPDVKVNSRSTGVLVNNGNK